MAVREILAAQLT